MASGRKKTWNFIQEKMSYDTFFTLKRLIERSRRPDEVLRWVTQNPGKISHNHYPIALHKISQLLQGGATPPAGTMATTAPTANASAAASEGGAPAGAASCPPGGGGAEESEGRDILEQQDFQTLCDDIIGDCAKFDNFSVVNCLYAVAALGEALVPPSLHSGLKSTRHREREICTSPFYTTLTQHVIKQGRTVQGLVHLTSKPQ